MAREQLASVNRGIAVTALALAAVGCSSSSAGSTATPSPSPPRSSAAPHPGGLIGVIDEARVAAVCADAREAQTVSSIGGTAVSEPLVAAAGLLERPPVDPTAAAAAVAIRRDLRLGHTGLALITAMAFCRAHGG
jgi:hypothetical protein